jgi:hypothetical protein
VNLRVEPAVPWMEQQSLEGKPAGWDKLWRLTGWPLSRNEVVRETVSRKQSEAGQASACIYVGYTGA